MRGAQGSAGSLLEAFPGGIPDQGFSPDDGPMTEFIRS